MYPPGEIGRTVRCEFAVGGQPVDAVATVSSVAATRAEFDIALQARPVTEELLEQDGLVGYDLQLA